MIRQCLDPQKKLFIERYYRINDSATQLSVDFARESDGENGCYDWVSTCKYIKWIIEMEA